jgi:hypothetical protein
MQGYKLTGLTEFNFLISNKLDTSLGLRPDMPTGACCFTYAIPLSLLYAHDVPCGIAIFR